MTTPPKISVEQIEAKWVEISPAIDRVMERMGTRGEFPVEPGSSLAGDDTASSPYQVSHAFKGSLLAGVDHLHALKVLVRDAHTLHTLAPFSLARGALENLSLAFWILHPATRDERIERTLRWHAKNFKDAEKALAPRGAPNSAAEPKLLKLEGIARQRSIAANVRKGLTSTEAVEYSDTNTIDTGPILFAWQLCSGYAHGRPWALLGTSDRKSDTTTQPGVAYLTLTANEGAVQWVALEALHLLAEVLRTYDQRAGSHLASLFRT